MGCTPSHPIYTALKDLLAAQGLSLKSSTLTRFLQGVDEAAPWFACSGHLTLSCWEKLGKDLDAADETGTLWTGVRAVWTLVRGCLKDEKCGAAVSKGVEALEKLKEERSHKSETQEIAEESSNEEEEEKEIDKGLEGTAGSTGRPPPTAPGAGGSTFHVETWAAVQKEFRGPFSFPVFQNQQQQRFHEPLDLKIVQRLAEATRAYGPTGSFTTALLDYVTRYCMTPNDWTNLAKACLSPGQYLDWKAYWIELAGEQAARNVANGNQAWDIDMLLGQGRFAQQQTGYPAVVYDQINAICVRAWRSVPNRGEITGNLTKILQGPNEPFADFLARLVEAATKIFGDPDQAMPLIKQLAFEQCTKECRQAIMPFKKQGLEAWMKATREIGTPLTNTGLAAAIAQMTKGANQKKGKQGCYACGQ